MSLKQAHYVEIDLLIEEIDSDRVIEADSLADLLIEEVDSHQLAFVADSLNWSWFESSWIEFDDTDYFDSTDSRAFWERKVCDSLAINNHMFPLILLIEWIDATEWAIDSLAIQQSCRWFYWFSDVVLSFDVVDHQVNKFLYTCFVVRQVSWMNIDTRIVELTNS